MAIYSNWFICQTVSEWLEAQSPCKWAMFAILKLVLAVINSTEGKIVKVKGHCYRGNQPIIELVSSFLYRGRFVDYENTFDTTEEPDYLIRLASDADVGVLQSKEWFEWENES